MFGQGRREKEVRKLFDEHMECIERCLNGLKTVFLLYVDGKFKEAEQSSFEVHKAESEADTKRRTIIERLYEGAFLPGSREDLIRFTSMADKIADHAESCCDFTVAQQPGIPEQFKDRFVRLMENSTGTFKPLVEGSKALFTDFAHLREKTMQVNIEESGVDKDEWNLTRDIFQSGIPLAEKIHLRELVWHISEISDVAQDAADWLEVLVVKKRV